MITEYLNYRYPGTSEAAYKEGLLKTGFRAFKAGELGFFTYAPAGDALILGDMYATMKRRGIGRIMLNSAVRLAHSLGKTCLITFSEDAGEHQEEGYLAAKAAGFKDLYSLNNKLVLIRGVQ